MSLRSGVRAVLLAVLALVLVLPATAATAATDAVPEPEAGPYFGPLLDWTNDSAREYSDRLGTQPSLFAQSVRYPLAKDDRTYLRQFVEQSAQQGALAVLTLEPTEALGDLTADDAALLGRQLRRLHDEYDTTFVVRFAPEMNGSWQPWGQQPDAYVAAFRTVADAVHDALPQADMLWSPSYGAGYPFGRAYGAVDGSGPRVTAQLDTDGNGEVDADDDPYAPYWPGDEYADWVGLSLYHFGTEQNFGQNVAPASDEYAERLDERFGYADDARRTPFYERFAERHDKPMAVTTGALYNPGGEGGSSELQIKRDWWRQVLDRDTLAAHPRIEMVTWLERRRTEAEVDDRVVDWRATHTSTLAEALAADLARDGATLGPVTRVLDQQTGNEATNQYRETSPGQGDQMGWIVFCVVLAFGLIVLSGLFGRLRPSWRYPKENDPRDERLDFFRGWTIVAVVITHIEVSGPYSWVTLNAIGAITGAEMFVLLSGVVLGMVYPLGVARYGEYATAVGAFLRARKQYLVALGVVILVYLLGLVPFIDASVITTFTDRGTGGAGAGAQGQVYDLYANAARLFDYPPPWYAVKQLLLLEMGPWVFNIMGLFVVLSLLVPGLMWLIRRRLWWLLLAVSWALYVLEAFHEWEVLPSQFEAVFPILTWQVAFTHGLVIGYYRRQITAVLTTLPGKLVVGGFFGVYAGVMLALWLAHRGALDLSFLPADFYDWIYHQLYQRTYLQPGRLLDLPLVLVAAYALLTTCWTPLNKAFGWFYTPLGRVSLYVFIVHVFFVLAVGNIPGLDRMSIWQGTLVHTAVLAAIWFMVRKRFLFKVIPA